MFIFLKYINYLNIYLSCTINEPYYFKWKSLTILQLLLKTQSNNVPKSKPYLLLKVFL